MLLLFIIVAIGLVLMIILGRTAHPSEESQWEIDRREQLAKIALLEERKQQMKHQTQGIIERYRQTQENRINAMLRQIRQEQEIEKLKAQVELLRRELGTRDDFDPEP